MSFVEIVRDLANAQMPKRSCLQEMTAQGPMSFTSLRGIKYESGANVSNLVPSEATTDDH